MTPYSLSRPLPRRLAGVAFFFAGVCLATAAEPSAAPATATAPDASAPLKSLGYSGSQQSLESLDRRIADAGTDPAKISALVADLVVTLKDPEATFAARQAICQRLGQILVVPSAIDPVVVVLTPWLKDDGLVNLARLALEPLPGAAVDTVFLNGLSGASGATRVALIQSIGNRRIAAAVPALARLLKEPDALTAGAAAKALSQIGTSAALAALLAAPDPANRTVVDARLDCAWRLPAAESIAALRAVLDDSRVFVQQRAAAFRGLLEREPNAASSRIVETLAGSDEAFKRVAIESIAASQATGLVPALAAKLSTWDPPTQAAVITALGRKGDGVATPAVVTALGSDDADVRAAAIGALGMLPGNPDVAARLARVAAGDAIEEAKLARQNLARLIGPKVADTIVSGAEQGDPKVRAVFLEEIGLRNMTEALPVLLKMHGDDDVAVRSAALAALADIAPPSEQPAILAWAVDATDGTEASRAIRALVGVAQRNPDAATRDTAITDAIDHGTSPVQLRLLPALSRLATANAAACASRLTLLPDEGVAMAATDALSRWPNDSVLPLLAGTAERSSSESVRSAALHGAMQFLERSRTVPMAEQSTLVALLLGTTSDAKLRHELVGMLGRGASDFALKYAETLQADPVLADDARDAALGIKANQDWPPRLKASAGEGQLNNLFDGKPKTAWSVPATAGQWVQVDLKRERPIHRITLDQTGHAGDYPEKCEVYVTNDAKEPGEARATVTGRRDKTVIEMPPATRGRILIIKSTEARKDGHWAIAELQID